MAYQSNDLAVLACANGFTLWHYTTADAASAVDTSGYFNAASTMLRVGDIIVANMDTCGTMKGGVFIVTCNSRGEVDVVNMISKGERE
jgi:hypothetical protein